MRTFERKSSKFSLFFSRWFLYFWWILWKVCYWSLPMTVSQTSPLVVPLYMSFWSSVFISCLCTSVLWFILPFVRCQVPSVMSVAIPYHRSDYQHFDACRMHLQNNTTRSKHYLHYIYFICFRMLFFSRSTGQVYNSCIYLLNVEHLIPQIEKK